MIIFYFMDWQQSRHAKKELAFKKALTYLEHNGWQRRHLIDFYDTKDPDDQGAKLNTEFDSWLENLRF